MSATTDSHALPKNEHAVLFDEDYRRHIEALERRIAWLENKLWESRKGMKSITKEVL